MSVKLLIVLFVTLSIISFGETGESHAQTISCMTVEKSRFFTDNPTFIPTGCHAITTVTPDSGGRFSVVTLPQLSASPGTIYLLEQSENRLRQNLLLEELQSSAQELVAQYNQTLARTNWNDRQFKRTKSRQEIRQIKERRNALLLKSATANLPGPDKENLKELLAAIPR